MTVTVQQRSVWYVQAVVVGCIRIVVASGVIDAATNDVEPPPKPPVHQRHGDLN